MHKYLRVLVSIYQLDFVIRIPLESKPFQYNPHQVKIFIHTVWKTPRQNLVTATSHIHRSLPAKLFLYYLIGKFLVCAFVIFNSFYLIYFFNLNDISPGSSHPSIQRGARPLTGDLPTTAPSPLTFEFWKPFPTLLYCLWLYCQWKKVLSISLTLDNYKLRLRPGDTQIRKYWILS